MTLRACFLFLALHVSLLAQSSAARITGLVSDPTSSPVPNATVELTNAANGLRFSGTSNQTGNYLLPNLPPGRYSLSAKAAGFQTASIEKLDLAVNQIATVNLALRVGQVEERVDVVADGAQIEAASTQLGTVISEEKVVDLPLNARNFTQLLALTPGAAPISVGQNSSGAQSQQIGAALIPAINGQSNRSNHFTLDGVFNDGVYMGTYSIAPNVDAISQFKVASHSDQAEFGGATGGVINVASKGGANQFHGVAYHFLRNDALDARAYFSARKPTLRQNQFGGTFSGPVIRNRLFFLFAYEGYRQVAESNILTLIPTPAQLGGDFRGNARAIYNPFSTRADAGTTSGFARDPFPDNRIPSSLLDRSTQAWAKTIIPAPIATGVANTNSRNSDSVRRPADNYSIRGDYQLSTRDLLFARYTWGQQNSNIAFAIPGTRQLEDRPAKNGGLNYTRVINASTVLNVLFGYSALSQINTPLLTATNLFSQNYFKGVTVPEALTAPGINLPGVFGNITARISDRGPMAAWQGRADLSKVWGTHSFKVGAEFIRHPWDNTTTDFALGFSTLQSANLNDAGRTGDTIASFVLGVPEDRTYIYPSLQLHSDTANLYFQDSWKVNSRLTFNYGLRWDIQLPPVMTKGIPATWDFNTGKFLVGTAKPGACTATPQPPCLPDPNNAYLNQWVTFTGNSRLRQNEWALLGPRLGLAYTVTPTFVVRSGFSVAYDVVAGMNQQGQNGGGGGWPVPDSFLNLALNRQTVAITADDPFRSAPAAVPAASPQNVTAFFYDPKFRNAVSYQWNLDLQKEFARRVVVTAAYVGSANTRLPVGGTFNTAQTAGPGNPRERALWPHAPATDYDRSIGRSKYHALQVKAEQRLWGGLSSLVAYTWSKSIDTASSGFFAAEDQSLQNPYDINSSRSVSGFDIPHVFSLGAVYGLPFGKGKAFMTSGVAAKVLGSWQLNAIALVRSGRPYTLYMNLDTANIGATGQTTRVRPNLLRDPALANPTPGAWFDKTAYGAPAAFTFGSSGRNQLRSDGLQNFDFSLFREDQWSERLRTQFRVEAFNLFNHASFGVPQTLFSSPAFGQVTGTVSTARQVQLGLKVIF